MSKKIHVITIDAGIPMPDKRMIYPFGQLDVGESFVIPLSKRSSLGGSMALAKKKYPGRTWATRKEGADKARVWRVT